MDGTKLFIRYVEILSFVSKFVGRMSEVSDILYGDVLQCRKLSDEKELMFWRRNSTRAVFAFVEGVTNFLKSSSIEYGSVFGGQLLADEIGLLTGKGEPYINERGDVAYSRPPFPKFLNDVRFAFKMFAKSLCFSQELQVGDNGWSQLRQSVEIRHRVVHPKDVAELEITDEEVETIESALEWFDRQVALFVDGLANRCINEINDVQNQMPDQSSWNLDDLQTVGTLLKEMGEQLAAVAARQRGGLWSGSETGKALQSMIGETLGSATLGMAENAGLINTELQKLLPGNQK